ncbi:MAG: DUF1211 domain-containing protein [Candidatus Eremiobacteraeota bacterium]|nr:DUF1211 domain-containing protein [Candidatus Eremiobacteraeota bacterium]
MSELLPAQGRFRDVHEERLTHRLEAFSDIVLGFSLAELSLNFVIPPRPEAVYTNVVTPVAFAFTFFIVSLTWYAHHRLFEYFFVPRVSTIVLNFVTLGLVVWLVYQLQVYARFANTIHHAFAATSYIVSFSVVWTMLGVMYAVCVKLRWPEIGVADRHAGVFAIGRIGSVGIGTLLTVMVLRALRWPPEISFWFIPVWAVAWRAGAARFLRTEA